MRQQTSIQIVFQLIQSQNLSGHAHGVAVGLIRICLPSDQNPVFGKWKLMRWKNLIRRLLFRNFIDFPCAVVQENLDFSCRFWTLLTSKYINTSYPYECWPGLCGVGFIVVITIIICFWYVKKKEGGRGKGDSGIDFRQCMLNRSFRRRQGVGVNRCKCR